MTAGFGDVAIIAVGARTPVGLTADASAAAVRGAISVIAKHPHFVDKAGEPMRMTRDSILPVTLDATDRCVELAKSAFLEATQPLRDHHIPIRSIPAVIGLPEERPGRSSDLEAALGTALMATASDCGWSLQVQTIAAGHSAGLMALDVAARRIEAGEIELCLAGGVDSYIQGETLEWLDANRQLLSAENRSAFAPGEAAGFCLVASASFLQRWSVVALARIVSVFTAIEENRIKTDTICIGEGLTAAVRGAYAALEPPVGRLEQTWCDLNGERYRSTEYLYLLMRAYSLFVRARVSHPADCWGDVGAASGPLFACLAVASWLRGYAAGPRALLWTSSESGYRTATILQDATAARTRQ